MLLAISLLYSLIFMYLFVRLALYHRFSSFSVVSYFTHSPAKGWAFRFGQSEKEV